MASSKKYEELPKGLRRVRPVVKRLFYEGECDPELFRRCVAIVGSRGMTSYGERCLEKIIPVLVEAQVTVVSGFMYGIDQAAHRVCLECGGKTIAVLGWGIKWPMADSEWLMAQKIIKNKGLMMSEWEEQTPALWTFPARNRIVAGLCQAILVVEAGEKSGSLITVNWAKKFKRKVLAVPGPITSKVSAGTNGLIKTGEAEMVTKGEDILQTLGWGKVGTSGLNPVVEGKQHLIVKWLENEALTVDEIARKLGRPVEAVGAELSLLTLQGKVKEAEGKYFTD